MKSRILLYKFIFLTIIFPLFSPIFGQEKQNDSVRTAFYEFKQSLIDLDGEKAFNLMDREIIQYYEKLFNWVRKEKKEKVKVLGLLDKYNILSFRHRLTVDELKEMDTRSFIIYAVKHGLTGRNSFLNAEIGKVEIKANHGTCQMVIQDTPLPFQFHFIREDSHWKIQLLKVIKNPQMNVAFINMIEKSGKSEEDFLFTLLEKTSGKPVDKEAIWKPLK